MDVVVLRLSHRHARDKRLTTHVALTARAFGAKKMLYTGDHDEKLEQSVSKIVSEWGGLFTIEHVKREQRIMEKWKEEQGVIVHLTMFGMELETKIDLFHSINQKMLVIVGGPKVPGFVFQLADFNVAIGNQPHSEVAALAVFLDRISKGKGRLENFEGGKIQIIPMEKSKKAIRDVKERE